MQKIHADSHSEKFETFKIIWILTQEKKMYASKCF
jgi:hypothetical protein